MYFKLKEYNCLVAIVIVAKYCTKIDLLAHYMETENRKIDIRPTTPKIDILSLHGNPVYMYSYNMYIKSQQLLYLLISLQQ